jgi:transposase InsO family protein
VTRFQFVADHQDTFEVKRMCEVVEISRSSFYAWLKAAPARAARAAKDAELAARIVVLQDPKKGGDRAYGAPRITRDLNDGVGPDEHINHKRVARVMRARGLAGIRLRRRVKTTQPDQTGRKYPDLIGRDFTADTPGQRYVGDITYLRINGGGFLYLATVIDLYSRKLAGWALADHMRVDLVIDALDAAARERGGTLAGAIFHSDHGSTYTAVDYAKACARLGVTQSMGAIGSSADNALAESFNATAKREMLAGEHAFASEATARRAGFRWASRYNTKRRHSACGYLSPNAYEKAHTTTMAEAA